MAEEEEEEDKEEREEEEEKEKSMSVFGWDFFVCIARAEDTFETAVSWSCSVVRSCDAATAASQRSVCAASFTLFDSFSFFGMVPTRPKENAECVFMKTWKELLGFSRENLIESPSASGDPGFKFQRRSSSRHTFRRGKQIEADGTTAGCHETCSVWRQQTSTTLIGRVATEGMADHAAPE